MITGGKSKLVLVVTVAILCYIGAYAFLRASHQIVCIENRSSDRGMEIIAPPEEWADVRVEVLQGRPLLLAYARAHQQVPTALNALFWPLRVGERACRRMLAKNVAMRFSLAGCNRR